MNKKIISPKLKLSFLTFFACSAAVITAAVTSVNAQATTKPSLSQAKATMQGNFSTYPALNASVVSQATYGLKASLNNLSVVRENGIYLLKAPSTDSLLLAQSMFALKRALLLTISERINIHNAGSTNLLAQTPDAPFSSVQKLKAFLEAGIDVSEFVSRFNLSADPQFKVEAQLMATNTLIPAQFQVAGSNSLHSAFVKGSVSVSPIDLRRFEAWTRTQQLVAFTGRYNAPQFSLDLAARYLPGLENTEFWFRFADSADTQSYLFNDFLTITSRAGWAATQRDIEITVRALPGFTLLQNSDASQEKAVSEVKYVVTPRLTLELLNSVLTYARLEGTTYRPKLLGDVSLVGVKVNYFFNDANDLFIPTEIGAATKEYTAAQMQLILNHSANNLYYKFGSAEGFRVSGISAKVINLKAPFSSVTQQIWSASDNNLTIEIN